MADLLRTPIDDFELSVRSVNSLKNSNIRTLGDLVKMTESQKCTLPQKSLSLRPVILGNQ